MDFDKSDDWAKLLNLYKEKPILEYDGFVIELEDDIVPVIPKTEYDREFVKRNEANICLAAELNKFESETDLALVLARTAQSFWQIRKRTGKKIMEMKSHG